MSLTVCIYIWLNSVHIQCICWNKDNFVQRFLSLFTLSCAWCGWLINLVSAVNCNYTGNIANEFKLGNRNTWNLTCLCTKTVTLFSGYNRLSECFLTVYVVKYIFLTENYLVKRDWESSSNCQGKWITKCMSLVSTETRVEGDCCQYTH